MCWLSFIGGMVVGGALVACAGLLIARMLAEAPPSRPGEGGPR